jgi:hypothetical protein
VLWKKWDEPFADGRRRKRNGSATASTGMQYAVLREIMAAEETSVTTSSAFRK